MFDFELASMLAQAGMTINEMRKKGMTKDDLRSLVNEDGSDEEKDSHDSDPGRGVDYASRGRSQVYSPPAAATIKPIVDRTPPEEDMLGEELTAEMAAKALMGMAKDSSGGAKVRGRRHYYGVSGYATSPSNPTGQSFGGPGASTYYQDGSGQGGNQQQQFTYQQQQFTYPHQQFTYPHQQYAYPHQGGYYQHQYAYPQEGSYYYPQQGACYQQYAGQYYGQYYGQEQQVAGPPFRAANASNVVKVESPGSRDSPDFESPSLAPVRNGPSLASILTDSGKINVESRNKSHEETWLRHFNNLQSHIQMYHEYPTHSKQSPSLLGQWCGRQRKHYRRVGPYKHGNPMPQHRIELMELLPGWRWEGAPAAISSANMANWRPMILSVQIT